MPQYITIGYAYFLEKACDCTLSSVNGIDSISLEYRRHLSVRSWVTADRSLPRELLLQSRV